MFCFHDFLGVSCIPLTCILSRFCLLICSFTILKVLLRKEVHSEQLLWNRSVDQIHKHVLSPSEPLPSPSSVWRGRFGKVEFFPQTDAQLNQRSGTWTQSVLTVHHCYPNVSSRFFFFQIHSWEEMRLFWVPYPLVLPQRSIPSNCSQLFAHPKIPWLLLS